MLKLFSSYEVKPNATFKKIFSKLSAEINFKYKCDSNNSRKIRAIKKLKTRLGRLIRDFEGNIIRHKIELKESDSKLLSTLKTVYGQSALSSSDLKQFNSNNKHVYSIHAPEVECIIKGKLNKKCEFGNKVSISRCKDSNFVLAAKSFHGNPYDGHTLNATIQEVEQNTKITIKKVFLDRGYKGSDYSSKGKIYTPYTHKKMSDDDKKNMKRRSAIEATISHLKNYYRLGTNYLKGKIGDIINPILASIGLNFSKIISSI